MTAPYDVHSIHKHSNNARNKFQVKMTVQSQKLGPGGQIYMQIGLENIEHDLMHGNEARRVGYNRDRYQMDGTTTRQCTFVKLYQALCTHKHPLVDLGSNQRGHRTQENTSAKPPNVRMKGIHQINLKSRRL